MRVGLWWRIGWRNVARHRRRTALTASALAVGYAAVMLMVGWMDGIIVQMVDNGTGLLTGQLQIQDQDYLPERSLYNTIGGRDGIDVQAILEVLRADPGISAATPRVYVGALLSSGEATAAVMVMGTDDEQETAVARLAGLLVRGRSPRPGANEVVIGEGMVRKLGSDVGDEIVLVAPAADGSMGNDLFTVTGVFSTGAPFSEGGLMGVILAGLISPKRKTPPFSLANASAALRAASTTKAGSCASGASVAPVPSPIPLAVFASSPLARRSSARREVLLRSRLRCFR